MKNFRKGFTLLEILLVVGIIAILAGIIIVAINPSKQLASVRNTERKSDIKTIYNAINQYYIDNSRYPTSLTSVLTEVCDTDTATSSHSIICTNLVDLSELVPKYLTAIPKDPQGPVTAFLNKILNIAHAAIGGTGYYVMKDPTNKVVLNTQRAELGTVIAIGTTTGMVVEEEIVVTQDLYWKNVGNDNSWNNVNNWFTDAEATTQAAGVPWTGVGLYFDSDLSLATGEQNSPVIDVDIDPNQVGITGTCDISNIYTSAMGGISIYSGTFNGDYFSLQNATIFGGTFSGDSSENSSGFIRGGIFSGDNFSNYNDSYIYDGNFTGANFGNYGEINGGTFSGAAFSSSYGSRIYNGTFTGSDMVCESNVYDGTFSGTSLTILPGSDIYGGTFDGDNFTNSGKIYGGTFSRNNLTISNTDFSYQTEALVADGITITIDSSCSNYLTPPIDISAINGGSIIYPQVDACGTSGDATDPDCWSTMVHDLAWGPYVTTNILDENDGSGNTTDLVALSNDLPYNAGNNYPSAKYCDDLTEGGHSDWYLPAINQLESGLTAYKANHGSDQTWGGFAGDTYYWSSSEYPTESNLYAWYSYYRSYTNSVDSSYAGKQNTTYFGFRCLR